ncbi:MAG: M48 family metalloprotease [bacterium]|nr:M48 family metalloprotease [bacterium]
MKRSTKWVLAGIGSSILLGVIAACTVNPVTGKSQLDLMGETQELQIGSAMYPLYTQSSLGEVTDPELQAYVQEVGSRLSAVGHRPALEYQFNAVNEPAVNAYALPGGKISFTRGLLSRLGSEDEMAAVLGHEVGHVTARHSAQQYTRGMLAQAILVAGTIYMEAEEVDNRQIYAFAGSLGASLLMARYSRNQERQSDDLGFDYMISAGYNPTGMVGVMEVLAAQGRSNPNLLERMFASHPQSSDRLAATKHRLAHLESDVLDRQLKTDTYRRRVRHVIASREAYDRLADARQLPREEIHKAVPMLRQSVDEWPDDGLLRSYYAIALDANGDSRNALRSAVLAAEDAPRIYQVQAVTGELFYRNQKYPEALQSLDRASELVPDQPEVELLRGQSYERMNRRDAAITAYRKVLQLAPDSEAARHAYEGLQRLGVEQQQPERLRQ